MSIHTSLRILARWKQAGHKTSKTFKRLSKAKPKPTPKPKQSAYIIDIDWRADLEAARIQYLKTRVDSFDETRHNAN